jgi:phosphoglycerol transferase MdoB-like AlkP superfamily enzyme
MPSLHKLRIIGFKALQSVGFHLDSERESLLEGSRSEPKPRPRYQVWLGSWLLPLIVPALTSLYVKYCLMRHGMQGLGTGGFRIAARSLGRDLGLGEGDGFTFWEKLSFFHEDLLVAVFVALVLFVLVTYLQLRWRLILTSVISAVLTLALYVQFRAFQSVGQFVSFRMLLAAFSWGLREPGVYFSYLGIKGLLTISVAAVLVWIALWWFPHHDEPVGSVLRADKGAAVTTCLAVLTLSLALPFSCARGVGASPYRASVLLTSLHAFVDEGDVQVSEFASLSSPELVIRYRGLTDAPLPLRNPNFWGKAEGSNVLFFVLETMPARFLQSDGKMDDLPNFRLLRQNSFLALQHYSAYPNTHQALFALFTSWYPSGVTKTFEEQHPDIAVPGMMRTLSNRGYYTAVYSPDRWDGFLDQEMFQGLGVQKQIFAPPGTQDPAILRRTRRARDEATLSLMKQDLEQRLTEGRKFAAAFLPQIGHGPLLDGEEHYSGEQLEKRERALLETQDAWLGELLQLLKRHHQLEQTLIIITGDHGIRSQEEDPSFVGGMIDEYSFHVPLLIYAPHNLDHPVEIPWVTSHIDVAPTVLDLLGVQEERDFEQGTPIWNPDLANRRTYLLAYAMFGADGYYSDGQYYMWSRMSDSVYVSRQAHFEVSNLVPPNSKTHEDVSRSIARMVGLQQVWASRFSDAKSLRNNLYNGFSYPQRSSQLRTMKVK